MNRMMRYHHYPLGWLLLESEDIGNVGESMEKAVIIRENRTNVPKEIKNETSIRARNTHTYIYIYFLRMKEITTL